MKLESTDVSETSSHHTSKTSATNSISQKFDANFSTKTPMHKRQMSYESIFVPADAKNEAYFTDGIVQVAEFVLDDPEALNELMNEIMIARWKSLKTCRKAGLSVSFSGESSVSRRCISSRIPVRITPVDVERRKSLARALNTTFIQ